MKKTALVLTLALAIPLGGCAETMAKLRNLGSVVSVATKTITNPVTPADLYNIESGFSIALSGLEAYKQSCIKGVAEVTCRDHIAAIQVYTRQLPPMLSQLRGFVRNNDQVNAVVVYNQVVTLINNFRTAAANVGVELGS
jgi:hypothetical protein